MISATLKNKSGDLFKTSNVFVRMRIGHISSMNTQEFVVLLETILRPSTMYKVVQIGIFFRGEKAGGSAIEQI